MMSYNEESEMRGCISLMPAHSSFHYYSHGVSVKRVAAVIVNDIILTHRISPNIVYCTTLNQTEQTLGSQINLAKMVH